VWPGYKEQEFLDCSNTRTTTMPNIATNDDLLYQQREIMAQYLASVQKEHEAGHESDEAMSTDSSPSDIEEEDESSSPSLTSAISSMALYDATHPADIASDDSAFSSDDEFSEDTVREQQRLRRQLVLGRAPPSLFLLHHRDIVNMNREYMKQLNDADIELAELTGGVPQTVEQRTGTTEYREPIDLRGPDAAAILHELRSRSSKEVFEAEKPYQVRVLVIFAQALFRKEREIKRILRARMQTDDDDDDQ